MDDHDMLRLLDALRDEVATRRRILAALGAHRSIRPTSRDLAIAEMDRCLAALAELRSCHATLSAAWRYLASMSPADDAAGVEDTGDELVGDLPASHVPCRSPHLPGDSTT